MAGNKNSLFSDQPPCPTRKQRAQQEVHPASHYLLYTVKNEGCPEAADLIDTESVVPAENPARMNSIVSALT